jgi:voltage-gated potassium channel
MSFPRLSQGHRSLWRRLEFAALWGTIPAFYLAMTSRHQPVGAALYLAAFVTTLGVSWSEWRPPTGHATDPRAGHRSLLNLPLGVALLLSAVLPQGGGSDLLILRLGTSVLTVLRWAETSLPSSWRAGLPQLLALCMGVLGLCGLGFWGLEPTARTFGDGLWLAFTTAATVGYGDIVPTAPAAKVFAVFVVLLGLAVLSLVTAAIAAVWVKTEERRIEHELLNDLHRELRSIRAELSALQRDRRP